VWHRAEAGAAGSVALNMAFNHTDATVLDLLLENLRHTLAREPGCREPFFAGPPGKAALAMDSHLDQCFDAVTSALRSMRRKGMTRRLARASRAQRS
jgi:hypothetical protein